jgi:D-alanyl-D-alanine carboxypeptidase/D-alanyl-D-alanine-endopeptidase (penicillin-binding protein 4)
MDMNKHSNNFYAEQVMRALGGEVGGLPADTTKGLSAISTYLTGIGVDEGAFVLVNGSGLSRKGHIEPRVLTAVLRDMASDPLVGSEFRASLAIAGMDGTLWRRLSEAPGRLRGKTGTIDGVHCLAGFLDDAGGTTYAFAFLVNGFEGSSAQVKRLHDRFARQVFELMPDDGAAASDPSD